MNLRCGFCQTPYALGRTEILAALQYLESEHLTHYDAHCPRCRRATPILRQKLEMAMPNWKEELKEAVKQTPAPTEVKPAEAKASAKDEAKPAAKKPSGKAAAKPAAKASPAKKTPSTKASTSTSKTATQAPAKKKSK